MASVGDYVTAVLLTELAADDEVSGLETQSKRDALLVDAFARQRQSRRVLFTNFYEMINARQRENENRKNKRMKTDDQNDEDEDEDEDEEEEEEHARKKKKKIQKRKSQGRKKDEQNAGDEAVESAITSSGHSLYIDREKLNDFRTYFGMKLETFESIAQYVGPKLVNQEKFRQAPHVKILIGLWLLTTQASFRCIGDKFNIQKSTTYYLFVHFVSVLASLADEIIRWPSDADQINAIAKNFEEQHGFPGVVGLVDSCQIPVKVSMIDDTEFPKGRAELYSTVSLQVVCDHRMRFTDVYVGEPQTPHAVMCTWKSFEASTLGLQLADDPTPLQMSNEDYHLLGNSTYPLRTYLLTPYKQDQEKDDVQRSNFNIKHKNVHRLVQRALGILNRKFLRLKFINSQRYELVPQIITAACVLHNIILESDDGEVDVEERSYVRSMDKRDYREQHVHPCPQADHHVPEDALLKRDLIAKTLNEPI